MAITLFSEDPPHSSPEENANRSTEPRPLVERVQRLEEEVTDLRGVVTRFADVVMGEVKQLHQKQEQIAPPLGENPPSPPLPAPGLVSDLGAVIQPGSQRRRWLLFDCVRDIRTTFQMYLDPQYRVRRSTQIMVPVLIGFFVLNSLFFSFVFPIPILSTILEKIGDISLAIILYKVLHQEMERYREAQAQYALWHTRQPTTGEFITMTTDPANPPTTRQETE
jgi:hypothetical protein